MPLNPADPMSWDPFNMETPHVQAPSPAVRTQHLLPDVKRLFQAQSDALQTLHEIDSVRLALKGKVPVGFDRMETIAENTYRVLAHYLKDYGTN